MPLIAVPANDIDVSGLALDVELPVDWLTAELSDADAAPAAPGHLTARLSRSAGDVVVRGRVQARVTTPCARCLGPAELPIEAELSLLLRPGKAAEAPHGHHAHPNGARKAAQRDKEPEYEFTAGEADIDTYDGETVVLDPFVREAILLEMPSFPLCSEACPGIRPAPSEDTPAQAAPPLDPRLAPLGALRDRLADQLVKRAKRPSDRPDQGPKGPAPTKKTKKKE
ncbi:MAG: DUF177 domain-containing protein [Polyangiaceae bacterium]|nr:DUF177 domain-containing protein [Polyangiaceae bacterium]